MRIRKSLVAGAAVVAAALIGGGVAYATWSTTGSGTGSALADTAQPVTVSAVALSSSTASLYPGGPAGNVYFTISNPNPYPIKITGIAWGTPTSSDPTACASSLISVDSGAPTSGLNLQVAANTTSAAFEVNSVLDLSSSAADACQGNGFSVPVTLSGQQVP